MSEDLGKCPDCDAKLTKKSWCETCGWIRSSPKITETTKMKDLLKD